MSLQPETIIYMGKAVPSSGSGAHTETALLSITTEPSAPFAKGSKYFRNEDGVDPELNKKIYTAVVDGTWENADVADPVFGAYYTYNGDTYTWDGDSLQIFELEDYQLIADKTDDIITNKTSSAKYPSTKAVYDYFVSQGTARNFIDAGITKTSSSYTFLELAEEIRGKQFATGTTLYGEVSNSGKPSGISNAEIRVEILETKENIINPAGSGLKSQVIEFTLFSTDVAPKEWSFIYYDQRNTPWTWIPKAVPTDDYISQATTTVPSSKALYDGLDSKIGIVDGELKVSNGDTIVVDVEDDSSTEIFSDAINVSAYGNDSEEASIYVDGINGARIDVVTDTNQINIVTDSNGANISKTVGNITKNVLWEGEGDDIITISDITSFQIPNAPLGTELPMPVLDDIKDVGVYKINFDLSAMAPGASVTGTLEVSDLGDSIQQWYQTCISNATFIFSRTYESNTWSNWYCISGFQDFYTPGNLVAGSNVTITTTQDESGYAKHSINASTPTPVITWYNSASFVGNTITIPDTSSASLVKVYYNGLLQQEDANGQTNDYSISGTTLTMNKTLGSDDKVAVEIM